MSFFNRVAPGGTNAPDVPADGHTLAEAVRLIDLGCHRCLEQAESRLQGLALRQSSDEVRDRLFEVALLINM